MRESIKKGMGLTIGVILGLSTVTFVQGVLVGLGILPDNKKDEA